MNQETIIINSQLYDSNRIEELKYECEPIDSWRNAIYFFLKHWFDDSNVIITRTSGSTGTPKEICLTKEAMRNSARMTNDFFGMNATKRALLCLPASYIAGKMMLVRAIVGGNNLIVVEPKANPFENLKSDVDFTAITPYQLHHSAETLLTKKVRSIIVGGGTVNSKMETLSANISSAMYETYGMTETASHIALRRFNGVQKSDFFTVLEGVNIDQDERGCLVIDAPHLTNRQLITNDIVELQDTRHFRWVGRADSVINSGGVKIFPEQVEKKLESFIAFPFFISAVADTSLGEQVVLVIESDNEIPQLPKNIRNTLNKFEIPKRIFYTPHFVYSQSNKILRKESLKLAMK